MGIIDSMRYLNVKNIRKNPLAFILALLIWLFISQNPQIIGKFSNLYPTPTITPTPSIVHTPTESEVIQVIDGDTVVIATGQKVRYIGINTPEIHHPKKSVECFGKEAAQKNAELVIHKQVKLVKDVSEVDKYGRLLRYVYLKQSTGSADLFVNDYLVREGYAYSSTYPPDVAYQELFKQSEREAREQNKGLWKVCKTT